MFLSGHCCAQPSTFCDVTFVRTKMVKGIEYRYLVQGVREGDRVRQKVVAYLGAHKTVKAAYAHWMREAKNSKDRAAQRHAKQMVQTLKHYL
jgi:hypothetical protein